MKAQERCVERLSTCQHCGRSYHVVRTTVSPDCEAPRVNLLVAILREWQRGAIGWYTAMHRADVMPHEALILRDSVSRHSTETELRAAVWCAVNRLY